MKNSDLSVRMDTLRNWYFWDETHTIAYGPYTTKKKARKACIAYVKSLDDGEDRGFEYIEYDPVIHNHE